MKITKSQLQSLVQEELKKLSEVTAGAEKFEDFEAIAQAYRADKTDRKVAQEMAYYIEDVVSPEMENLGLRDTATDSAKSHGLFDWSAREGEPYKNASIDLYGDGYEVEVYPSSNDDDMQKTTTKTLMDAIKFVRGVLSSEGAVAPGEDPAQMELPLEEYGMSYGGGRGVGLAQGVVDWDKKKKEKEEKKKKKALQENRKIKIRRKKK